MQKVEIEGGKIYKMHHDLDIHPIPEKVLYINELGIADTACYYDTEEQHQKALTGRIRTNGGILPMIMFVFMYRWT